MGLVSCRSCFVLLAPLLLSACVASSFTGDAGKKLGANRDSDTPGTGDDPTKRGGGPGASSGSGDENGPGGTGSHAGGKGGAPGSGNGTGTSGNAALGSGDGSGTNKSSGLDTKDGRVCVKDKVDLNFMILLDTTGSMGSQDGEVADGIPALLNQVTTLRRQLKDKVGTLRIGFVSYIDQIREGSSGRGGTAYELDPTDDVVAARKYVGDHAHSDGDHSDTAEGGLWALNDGLKKLKAQPSSSNGAINVEIVVTDAWSHDGTPHSDACNAHPNDCEDDDKRTFDTTDTANLLADEAFKSWFLFDWSPDHESVDGSGNFGDGTIATYKSPKGQWQALRDKWQDLHKAAKSPAGAHLGNEIDDGPTGMTDMVKAIADQLSLCN